MYYPALFATFPVDKQRITIVKLSSGAPGTMTTAVEGNGVVPGGWWVFGWGKHFAVVTGTKAARAIHVALLHDLVVSSLRARAGGILSCERPRFKFHCWALMGDFVLVSVRRPRLLSTLALRRYGGGGERGG